MDDELFRQLREKALADDQRRAAEEDARNAADPPLRIGPDEEPSPDWLREVRESRPNYYRGREGFAEFSTPDDAIWMDLELDGTRFLNAVLYRSGPMRSFEPEVSASGHYIPRWTREYTPEEAERVKAFLRGAGFDVPHVQPGR